MPTLVTPESNASQLYNALVMPTVSKWLTDRGYVMGDFNGGRNLVDVMRDRVFQSELNDAMHGAAQADRPAEERLLRGFATLGGVKWTPDLEKMTKSISGDLATIAPYLQAAAPDVWDQLHGSDGSVASLTSEIAQANQHFASPKDAHNLATGVFKELYEKGDHLTTRGFSAREMGQIYRELVKRGRISPNATPAQMAAALSKNVAPISAIRDSMMSQTRAQPKLEDVFSAYDAMPREAFNGDPAEMETQIRMGLVHSRAGGLYSTSAIANGGIPENQSLQGLEQQDQALRQQAAISPIGNMVAATSRLSQEYGFPNSSPGAAMLQQMQAGQVPFKSYSEWQQAMLASGIPNEMVRQVIAVPAANQPYLTPELTNAVRQSQKTVDIGRFTDRFMSGMQSRGQNAAKLAPLARDQAAISMGYTGSDQMDALHGPVSQGTTDFLGKARTEAGTAAQTSGIGQAGFVQRMSDAVQQATPQTSIKDLTGAALNVVPHAKLQGIPGLQKAGELDPSYSPEHPEECCPCCGARQEQNTYDEKCNRCGGAWPVGASYADKLANCVCPVCGSALVDIRGKLICPACHAIVETCCEGGRGKYAEYADKLTRLRERRGECVKCGKVPWKCDCAGDAMLLLVETESDAGTREQPVKEAADIPDKEFDKALKVMERANWQSRLMGERNVVRPDNLLGWEFGHKVREMGLGLGLGSAAGALLGNQVTKDKDKKTRNTILGALAGAATGAASPYLYRQMTAQPPSGLGPLRDPQPRMHRQYEQDLFKLWNHTKFAADRAGEELLSLIAGATE